MFVYLQIQILNIKKYQESAALLQTVSYTHLDVYKRQVHASAHTGKYNWPIGTQKTDTLFVKDLSEKFHVYKADWSPEKIDIYVDDNKFFTYVNTCLLYTSRCV